MVPYFRQNRGDVLIWSVVIGVGFPRFCNVYYCEVEICVFVFVYIPAVFRCIVFFAWSHQSCRRAPQGGWKCHISISSKKILFNDDQRNHHHHHHQGANVNITFVRGSLYNTWKPLKIVFFCFLFLFWSIYYVSYILEVFQRVSQKIIIA